MLAFDMYPFQRARDSLNLMVAQVKIAATAIVSLKMNKSNHWARFYSHLRVDGHLNKASKR